MMRSIRNILLDDGGVMNDNNLRGPEWQRLVAEYLAPRLGATKEAWAEANHVVFTQMWREFEDVLRPVQTADRAEYFDFFGEQRGRWLRDMCEHVGVEAPSAEDCYTVGVETEQYVLPRVRAGFPGAADAIKELYQMGYRLGTASGQTAFELEGYLTGLGVRELFSGPLYGPDLVGAMKGTTAYYQRILGDAGLEATETLVVDDQPLPIKRAAAAGITTVYVGKHEDAPEAGHAIALLAELPTLLAG
jgi:phosphoglycolate phosphatase-like HAD superfamily hydrolase